MPLFFSKQDPNFSVKRSSGQFEEHIEGRSSLWAYRNSPGKLDRNYALFFITPAVNSHSPIYRLSQFFQRTDIPSYCFDPEYKCSVKASAWIRIDKIWGHKETNSVKLEICIAHRCYSKDFDPYQLQSWQYQEIITDPIANLSDIEELSYSINLGCNRGAIYVDDLYMELTPTTN